MAETIYGLAFQQGYQCGQTGNCCYPGKWEVPVEPEKYRAMIQLMDEGKLHSPGNLPADDLFEVRKVPGQKEPHAFFKGLADGRCGFFDAEGGNNCAVQVQAGLAPMAITCRMYPRVSVRRPAGLFLVYSFSCPTATDMLFEGEGGLRVVTFPPDENIETLTMNDHRKARPPHFTPKKLFNWDGYQQWENDAVATLSRDDLTPETALITLCGRAEMGRAQFAGKKLTDPFIRQLLSSPPTPEHLGALEASMAPGLPLARKHFAGILKQAKIEKETVRQLADLFLARYGGQAVKKAEEQLAADYERYVRAHWASYSLPLKRFLSTKLFIHNYAAMAGGIRSTLFLAISALFCVRVGITARCAERQTDLTREILAEVIQVVEDLLLHGGVTGHPWDYFDRAEQMSGAEYMGPIIP